MFESSSKASMMEKNFRKYSENFRDGYEAYHYWNLSSWLEEITLWRYELIIYWFGKRTDPLEIVD